MFCHDTARNMDHKKRDCPILKKLGVKIEKRTEANNRNAASCVAKDNPSPAPTLASSANPPLPLDNSGGNSSLSGGFLAIAELGAYNSGNEYDYEGNFPKPFIQILALNVTTVIST
jgi:hypothetical protein